MCIMRERERERETLLFFDSRVSLIPLHVRSTALIHGATFYQSTDEVKIFNVLLKDTPTKGRYPEILSLHRYRLSHHGSQKKWKVVIILEQEIKGKYTMSVLIIDFIQIEVCLCQEIDRVRIYFYDNYLQPTNYKHVCIHLFRKNNYFPVVRSSVTVNVLQYISING